MSSEKAPSGPSYSADIPEGKALSTQPKASPPQPYTPFSPRPFFLLTPCQLASCLPLDLGLALFSPVHCTDSSWIKGVRC